MALGAPAPVALCTVVAAARKTTVPRKTAAASIGTGRSPVDSSKTVTQPTWSARTGM